MNYKDKFNKERLSFNLIIRDKKSFSEFKIKFFTEILFLLNILEDQSFARVEILNFVQEKVTTGAHSFYHYLLFFNYINALTYIFENYKKIALDAFLLQKLHKIVFEKIDVEAGQYRKGKATVPGLKVKLSDTKDIVEQVKEFESFLNKKNDDALELAFEAHYKFLMISPFKNGNFHIAFLLLALMLLKNGYAPIVLRSIDKKRYLDVIENYQAKNKKEQYYTFMRAALTRSFQIVLENSSPMGRENLLTIAKFAKLCDVPVSTIRYWMKEGYIKPVVFTPSGYALFNENQKIDIQEAKLTKMISKCMSSLKKGIEKASGQS